MNTFTLSLTFLATIVCCFALPELDSNCQWSGCEGITRSGQGICDQYGAGRYTKRTVKEGCGWDTERVECCKPLPPGTVKWTKSCYGSAYGSNYVCNSEYGAGFRGTGKSKACKGFQMTQYECKN